MRARDAYDGRPARQSEYYDQPTLWFHWLTALLVLALFGTAVTWNYITPHNRALRPVLESTHVSLGILFAVLIFARIIWRLTGMRQPPAEAGLSGLLSRGMYVILYILLVAEAILGFVVRWAQGEDFSFFGLFSIAALMARNRSLAHVLEDWHNYIAWAIVVLALGHALAALVHHYVLKDTILERMWLPHRRRTTA